MTVTLPKEYVEVAVAAYYGELQDLAAVFLQTVHAAVLHGATIELIAGAPGRVQIVVDGDYWRDMEHYRDYADVIVRLKCLTEQLKANQSC